MVLSKLPRLPAPKLNSLNAFWGEKGPPSWEGSVGVRLCQLCAERRPSLREKLPSGPKSGMAVFSCESFYG